MRVNGAIPDNVATEIEERLQSIESSEGVRYLLAVESGSRAWGFPSPDSDYDVRFIYVRPRDWYLSIRPGRDVIETPLVDDIDLNGWDIRKALGLMLKSNVIVSEWIESPIRYRPDCPRLGELRDLADRLFDPLGAMRHYWSLGTKQAERWLGGDEAVPVKKYFYALRPALAMRAMRTHQGVRPPMNLQQLVAICDLPAKMAELIDQLVELKRVTNERANARRFRELDAFIRSELEKGRPTSPARPSKDRMELANAYFRSVLLEG